MRGVVGRVHGIPIGCPRQAERRLPLIVEPVGQEADPELVLDGEVLQVRSRGLRRRLIGELVAIHEERHARKDGAASG